MNRVPEKKMIQKNGIGNIFLIISFFSIQNMYASLVIVGQDVFTTYIFQYCFNTIRSIDGLKKNYYNFCLLSKKYYEETKKYWNENWFSMMEQICDKSRYERIYFAGTFKHVNKDIACYFATHTYLFTEFFDRNPMIQSMAAPKIPWGLGTQEGRRRITMSCIESMDPNFTTFGPNGQMSLLECTIKNHSVYFEKIQICTYLIQQGARYDIWIPGILKKEKKIAYLNNNFSFFKSDYNADKTFLKRMRKPMLLSYFIAHHKDLTYGLAKLILEKGTACQNDFIKRFPNLEQYRKEKITAPPKPNDFEIKNAFSLFRAYEMVSLNPNFFKNHFGGSIYQPLNYKKVYTYYNEFSVDSDRKTMLDYVSKKSHNPKAENERLKIITVLKYNFLLRIVCTIAPKRLKWLLIEFVVSQSKKRIIVLSILFITINVIGSLTMVLALFFSVTKRHFKAQCLYFISIFMLGLSFHQFIKQTYDLQSKDTLYDPYYFIHL